MTAAAAGFSMPPEWSPQEAVWLSWPVEDPRHWGGGKRDVMWATFAEIAAAISRHEPVRINAPGSDHGAIAAGLCSLLVFLKLGWTSAFALFLTYFFMSIMFPTIFSLGIYGLGARAKKASSFIVMAIMGGAIMPKLMGHIADKDGMSAGFIVPLVCFIWVVGYSLLWSKLSGSEGVVGVDTTKGH